MAFENFGSRLKSLFFSAQAVNIEKTLEQLSDILIEADIAVDIVENIIAQLKKLPQPAHLSEGLQKILQDSLKDLTPPSFADLSYPQLWLIFGVNGAGKTTTIGKLAHFFITQHHKKVMLAAADNYRAAAIEQLSQWASRTKIDFFSAEGVSPSAVAFQATQKFIASRNDVLLLDTAGRLANQTHLMDELEKITKVTVKALQGNSGVNVKKILVLDAHSGQNMLSQIKLFNDKVGIDGLILTKLDGIGRGGGILSMSLQKDIKKIPVYFIGLGEKLEDLRIFNHNDIIHPLFENK